VQGRPSTTRPNGVRSGRALRIIEKKEGALYYPCTFRRAMNTFAVIYPERD
jgi:hypothetical protein